MGFEALEGVVLATSGSVFTAKTSRIIIGSALLPILKLTLPALRLPINQPAPPILNPLSPTRTISLPFPPSPIYPHGNYVIIGCALAAAAGTGALIVMARRGGPPGGPPPPPSRGSRGRRSSKAPNTRRRRGDNEDPPPPPPPPGPGSSIDDKPKHGKDDIPPAWFIVLIFTFYIVVFLTICRAFPNHFRPVNRRVNRLLRRFSKARQLDLDDPAFRELLGALVGVFSRASGVALPNSRLHFDPRVHQEVSQEPATPGIVFIAAIGAALIITLGGKEGERDEPELRPVEPQVVVTSVVETPDVQEEKFEMEACLEGMYLESLLDMEAPDFDAADICGIAEDFNLLDDDFGTGWGDDDDNDGGDDEGDEGKSDDEVDHHPCEYDSDAKDEAEEEAQEEGSDEAEYVAGEDEEQDTDATETPMERQRRKEVVRGKKKETAAPFSIPIHCYAPPDSTVSESMFTSASTLPLSGPRIFDFWGPDPDDDAPIIAPQPCRHEDFPESSFDFASASMCVNYSFDDDPSLDNTILAAGSREDERRCHLELLPVEIIEGVSAREGDVGDREERDLEEVGGCSSDDIGEGVREALATPSITSSPLNLGAPSFVLQTPSSQPHRYAPDLWTPSSQGAVPIVAPRTTMKQRLQSKKQARESAMAQASDTTTPTFVEDPPDECE